MKANEVYTKQDFIAYLDEIGAKHEEKTVNGIEFVYVYDEKAYGKKSDFVPYMRVSHFDNDEWYVRDCGWCEDRSPEDICNKAWRMTRGLESA